MPAADGDRAVVPMQWRHLQLTFEEGRMMKKLFMVAMAAVFSMAMVSTSYAGAATTDKPATTDKKADAPADKSEKKKAEKSTTEKSTKKKAANPCAAKGEMKGEAKADAPKTDAPKGEAKK
jgi:zona occludens toxin (predicted ATPase)